MTHVAIFVLLLCAVALLSWLRGGAPERAVAMCFVLGFVATLASYTALPVRFTSVETAVALIDVAMLVALVAIAMKADRMWPMLVAGLQLDIVMVHALKAADADVMRSVYAIMMTVWAYPQLALLAVGVVRHWHRMRKFGFDRSWAMPAPAKSSGPAFSSSANFVSSAGPAGHTST